MPDKISKKVANKVKSDNERGSRRQLIEELFYDFNRSKAQVYWLNFTRGLFFGFGTILGGTVLVAFIIWFLSQLVIWSPDFLGQYIQQVVDALQRR
jgi:hypothetical protein